MASEDNLYLVFNFKKPSSMGNTESLYEVIYLFSDQGEFRAEELEDIFDGSVQLKFKTKEELSLFTQELQIEIDAEKSYLLAVNDYNIGLESSHTLQEFKTVFEKYGTEIILDKNLRKKKGLLGRLF